MKKIALTLILCCAVVFAYAQKIKESDVPQAVKDAFKKMYPNATVNEWEKEDGNYEAEFVSNKVETSVVFTPAGVHVMTEVEIPVSELPAGVTTYVNEKLGGKKIKEAAKMTTADGVVTYEAEVNGTDYIFDAAGNYISTETEDSTQDDDK